MKRQPETHEAGPGQDSFLDIVSNLVGILIILVMVIGVQAKYALLEHREAPENHKARQALASERL
ncbi:MAG TPA: hypothetical protein ENJ62_05435, partial [Bryobacterales bacterium]|nr:hypothetical protein [Bryobacterales bacterium]